MAIPTNENRRHPRVSVILPVTFHVRKHIREHLKNTAGEVPGADGRTQDLSQGGLCLITESPLEKDAFLELELDLKILPRPIRAFSNVVWIQKVGEAIYRVGVQFIEMKGPDQDLVRNYVQQQLLAK